MMGVSLEKDFYDYMLVRLNDDEPYMLIVNVTIGNIKAGSIICYVTCAAENHSTVTAQALRRSFGGENVYYIYKD
ncbi:hypothetical protein CDA63_08510 [Hymenobacter amundsenii]|uniref:Uncharacterized protein n=1 Tax=Hymenobacter amundsenii TaxID=2006685 RepID=A0A246FLJ4_9BACT|nr:hypothetical protein CDA63_08510 [Hymenobacter amundsenii]